MSVSVEVVDREDHAADHAAAALLARPMEGSVRLALTRNPSPLGSAELIDRPPQLILAREGNQPVGMAMAWRRPVFLDGAEVEAGYLGQLRLERPLGRGPLTRGFALALADSKDVAVSLTTIARDNHRARRLLERGLRGLPIYHPVGDITTLVFPTRLSGGGHARPAERGDAPAIRDLLDQQKSDFTLCPRWPSIPTSSSDPASPSDRSRVPDPGFPVRAPSSLLPGPGSRVPGHPASIHCDDAPGRSESTRYRVPGTSAYRDLTLEDFLVAEEGSRLVGACALWDQRGFKQTVIAGYSRLLRVVRPISNALARLAGRSGLPTPGAIVPLAFLSHVVAPTPAVARDLVRSAMRAARSRGVEWLSLSLSAKDPLLATLFRLPHRRYDTRLYAVGKVEPALVSAISAGFRPEGALL